MVFNFLKEVLADGPDNDMDLNTWDVNTLRGEGRRGVGL